MARSLSRFFPVLLSLPLLLAAGACDDNDGGGGGESLCKRLCALDDLCDAGDTTGPLPLGTQESALGASPAPIGDGGPGEDGRNPCVEDCLEDYNANSCMRARAPALVNCVESHGCEGFECLEEAVALDACGEGSADELEAEPEPPGNAPDAP
jgi:hypothetical protein